MGEETRKAETQPVLRKEGVERLQALQACGDLGQVCRHLLLSQLGVNTCYLASSGEARDDAELSTMPRTAPSPHQSITQPQMLIVSRLREPGLGLGKALDILEQGSGGRLPCPLLFLAFLIVSDSASFPCTCLNSSGWKEKRSFLGVTPRLQAPGGDLSLMGVSPLGERSRSW